MSVVQLPISRIVQSGLALRQKRSVPKPIVVLSRGEIDKLIAGAKLSRWGERDAMIVKLSFSHALRVSELCGLRCSDVDLEKARLRLQRSKGGDDTHQAINGSTLRMLRRYLRTRKDEQPWLFVSERGGPLDRRGVDAIVKAAAKRAGLSGVHTHTLRHSAGYVLANTGHDLRSIAEWLGHKSLSSTVRYTQLAEQRLVAVSQALN